MNEAGIKMNDFHLSRNGGEVLLSYDNGDANIPVRILLVAPFSDDNRTVSILHKKEKTELALVHSIQSLDKQDQAIIQEELKRRYFLPKILEIHNITIHLGDYYWDVTTDRGRRKFLLSSPAMNIRWLSDKRLLLSDSEGIKYELENVGEMDEISRGWVDRIL